jgi:hypothetical protein
VEDLRRKRQLVSAFLLRHGWSFPGKSSWGGRHASWLSPAGWHLIGDRFVLLDGGTIGRVIDPMAWRNTALHYKAVSAGLAIAAAADTVFTDTGASLNPSATVRMKLGAVTPVGT